ncbi:serine hydrolase domain-containing protein [Microbacterium sp. Leaf320]|uniref:serine hydrolase domain-containing protein n=1 Tax=Microbacterium sp. Leaf320 TaxID=1736334 RepID=UPI000B1BD3BE|nr:serine hydrolase [Microbacterium sp. Leaf320]
MTSLIPRSLGNEGRVSRNHAVTEAGPTLDTWQDAPHNRWAFGHVSEFVPTARIAHRTMETSQRSVVGLGALAALPTLGERLEESYTDALVVVRDDEVIAEHYHEGHGPDSLHLLMSVSKSICGLTIGTLVADGRIDPDRRVDHYVPDLTHSAYGAATVQQVLDMTVDVDYDEDYRNPASEVQAQDRVAGWRPRRPEDPQDTYAFLASLRGGGDHGKRFRYCSAGTDVLAWIVENVTGLRYHEAVSQRLWSQLGCDQDAQITVDSGGFGFANGGIACTARDLTRVGRVMLGSGTIDGRRVLSEDWIRQTLEGGKPSAASGTVFQRIHPGGSYSNQWWITGSARGDYYAAGIHGQFIWVDPATRTVIVKFSSWPEPVTEDWNRLHSVLFREICDAIS